MKKLIFIWGTLVPILITAQTRYELPNKKHDFSQRDWLNIMSDMANDSILLRNMKHYTGVPIAVHHKPYACYIDCEHEIVLEFCPECNWMVGGCNEKELCNLVSVTASSEYGFTLTNVITDKDWIIGDSVNHVFFTVQTSLRNPGQCYLVPKISQQHQGAYPIYPSKKVRTKTVQKNPASGSKKQSRPKATFLLYSHP